jgi:hypothetical protein
LAGIIILFLKHVAPGEHIVIFGDNHVVFASTAHESDVVDIEQLLRKMKFLWRVVNLKTCLINVFVCVLNEHGVLPHHEIGHLLRLVLIVTNIHEGRLDLALYHVYSDTGSSAHLSSVIFAPGVESSILEQDNGVLIRRVHLFDLTSFLFGHGLSVLVEHRLQSMLVGSVAKDAIHSSAPCVEFS